MGRTPALAKAQTAHDQERADRRVVLRLTEDEAAFVRRKKHRGETPAAFFRRLLAELRSREG